MRTAQEEVGSAGVQMSPSGTRTHTHKELHTLTHRLPLNTNRPSTAACARTHTHTGVYTYYQR